MIDRTKLLHALNDGKFETTEDGLLIPSMRIEATGEFCYHKRGEPEEFSANLVVTEGLNYILGSALRGVTPIPSWYIAVFSGNVTVQATWTAASFTADSTEVTGYTSATRPAWAPAAVSGGVISSYAAKAEFEATSSITLRGAGLVSASAKSATTGTLISASKFATAKALELGEILDVGYKLTLTAV